MNYQQEQEAMKQVECWLWAVKICLIIAVLYRIAEYVL